MLPRVHARSVLTLVIAAALGLYGMQFLQVQPTIRLAYGTENLLRLHVLANSDSAADQNLKLAVRDALLPLFAQITAEGRSAAATERQVRVNEAGLVARAEEVIRAAGRNYPVRIEIGDFQFPEKTSPAVTLPAGRYRAVRVIIGEGAGHNWWCVLFPPLCFTQEAGGVEVAHAAKTARVGGKPQVQVRLRLLPALSRNVYVAKAQQIWNGSMNRLAGWGAAEARTRTTAGRSH